MLVAKKDIIAQLQKDILRMQGFRLPSTGNTENIELGPVNDAFPNSVFPLASVHEFVSTKQEDAAATNGFVAGILNTLMRNRGATIWISSSRMIFPPALKAFNIEPDQIIFVDLKKARDVLWTMEEALKCGGLAAVVGELTEISFTASRRFQLAVEQSGVTGFILRHQLRNCNITASVSRWKISSLSSELEDDMPGVGFPRWNVELLKIRNGKPGAWQIEWSAGKFRHIPSLLTAMQQEQKRKAG